MRELKVLEKDFALDQIGRLFPLEWKLLTPDEIVITNLSVGHCNCVYTVENIKPNQSKEPTKLIVRIYGGNYVGEKPELIPQSVEGESVIFYEASRQRICPRLYGLFKGGRIEEYIDMRPMVQDDMLDLDLTREIAKILVKFHYLELPLPKPAYDFVDVHMNMLKTFNESAKEHLRQSPAFAAHFDPTQYCDYDYEKAIKWLHKLNDPSLSRSVLMHWDPHIMNIILTKDPAAYGGQKVFLCDLEMAAYNTRAKDLGLYLVSHMVNFAHSEGEGEHIVRPFPLDEAFTKVFLTSYQEALGESGLVTDFDPTGRDSYDSLLFESMVGAMNSSLCFLLFGMSKPLMLPKAPTKFSNFIHMMFTTFMETKKVLENTFPKYKMDSIM